MNLTAAFHMGIIKLDEIVPAVEKLSTGRRWLIGGRVYRTIAAELYGTPMKESDFDFLVENSRCAVVPGWAIERNRHNGVKLRRGKDSIDIMSLQTYEPFDVLDVPRTIESFLDCVPFTIQSIAYDLQERKIIGDVGIAALMNQKVEVHNAKIAERYAESYHTTIEKRRKKIATSLYFS